MSKTGKQKMGQLGEKISTCYLVKRRHHLVCRNYQKKVGEIDIITVKSGILHFIEVKTAKIRPDQIYRVTHETTPMIGFNRLLNVLTKVTHETQVLLLDKLGFSDYLAWRWKIIVSYETLNVGGISPEENLHKWKKERLKKTIELYILENDLNEGINIQIDIALVYLDFLQKKAIIRFVENVVFDD